MGETQRYLYKCCTKIRRLNVNKWKQTEKLYIQEKKKSLFFLFFILENTVFAVQTPTLIKMFPTD